jgi:hypothetical protein
MPLALLCLVQWMSPFPARAQARDVTDLLREKRIAVESGGSGIKSVTVRVRKLVPRAVTVRFPVGSFFVSANPSAQNMVSTSEETIRLTHDGWYSIAVPAACANRPRDIPNSGDTFTILRSPQQKDLTRLMAVISKTQADFPTRQAAVWIVTDDAFYADLGILIARPVGSAFGGRRTIDENATARAMQVCEQAGIDIRRKRIWQDRAQILRGVTDRDVKGWLQRKR